MKNIFKKFFSIETLYRKDKYGLYIKKYKKISIFGIKFNVKQKFSPEYECLLNTTHFLIDELRKTNVTSNKNLILNLILNPPKSELYYYKNNSQIYIFSKEFLDLDNDFIYNYLDNTREEMQHGEIVLLDKNSDLYQEHLEYAKKGEFCWKYVAKHNGIFKTSLYKNNNELYFKYDFLGLENAIFNDSFTWASPKPRKYVSGVSFYDKLIGLSEEEKFEKIKKFFDWFFEKYKLDNGLISGEVADCHFKNFIVDDNNGFYYTDNEYKSLYPLEKGYCIYFALSCFDKSEYNKDDKMYRRLIAYYNLPDKFEEYKEQKISRLVENIDENERTKKELANRDLIQKYIKSQN